MDDIITYGSNQEEHDTRLRDVLERARDNNLRLKKSKCHIQKEEVKFHGHIFTKDGLKPDPEKVRAVVDMARPTDKAGVQRLLGMVNYVNKFIPNMSDLTSPLRQLLHQDVEWHWEGQHETGFEKVKEALARSPVLGYYDAKKELTSGCQLNRSGCSVDSRGATHSLCFKGTDAHPAELRPNRKRTFGCGIRVCKV